ncbi:MAG: multicopper oxidase domain-containing protein [Gammaproteobacteria bacterium]|nr:multicopper oxidase domain-containing protein [Gammaproteobacteria bacterium]
MTTKMDNGTDVDVRHDAGQAMVGHSSDERQLVSRRAFLRAAALVAGGSVAAPALSAVTEHAGHGGGNYQSMMFMPGHNMAGQITEPPGAPADDEVDYQVFDLDVRIVQHEIVPGIRVPMFAFNGQVPGPEFHVYEGDWVKVIFTNNTEEMHTIHWHGLTVPYTMDGVPMLTQDPVHPGQVFVYRFQAKPSGTRWYHCHWGTPLHAAHGMHGAFIVHRRDDPLKKHFPYQRDYTLMLEAWDIDFAREEIEGLLRGMKELNTLMQQGRMDPMTHGLFRSYQDYLTAVQDGRYIPPYLQGRSSGVPLRFNFFGINGKAHPAGRHLGIRRGEWIRVRLINAGDVSHHMHLHGHDFWWVAQDGNDLLQPQRLNTIHVHPGGTYDIMIYGDNPGYWAFHNHATLMARNNGVYPGGAHAVLEYEDFTPSYRPTVSVDQ